MAYIVNLDQLEETKTYIVNRFGTDAEWSIVLGTGLGGIEKEFEVVDRIPYNDLPYVPISTTESHKGELILGKLNGRTVVIVSGRFHMYEGYSASESVYLIHVLNAIGIKKILITNAVGGVNPHFDEGDIVVVTDHINFFPDHPLRGKNHDALGPKFLDMSKPYDSTLIGKAKEAALKFGLELKEGVYFGWPGPSLETPAEYKMIHIIGADMVGMSTIPEVIVARYYGMEVLCFSIVSNVCFPKSKIKETTVEEVIRVVVASVGKLQDIIREVLIS